MHQRTSSPRNGFAVIAGGARSTARLEGWRLAKPVAILRGASLRDAPQDEAGNALLVAAPFHLRPYRAADEDAAIALWLETWRQAYPAIDFAARVPWWRERWRNELVPKAAIIVAEQAGALIGFVTIDASGYLCLL